MQLLIHIFFLGLAWLPKRPILCRDRNLKGSTYLLSILSLVKSHKNLHYAIYSSQQVVYNSKHFLFFPACSKSKYLFPIRTLIFPINQIQETFRNKLKKHSVAIQNTNYDCKNLKCNFKKLLISYCMWFCAKLLVFTFIVKFSRKCVSGVEHLFCYQGKPSKLRGDL